MLTIPVPILQEMHKMASEGTVLMLLSIPEKNIYLVRNNEDIVWVGTDAGSSPPARTEEYMDGYTDSIPAGTWQRFYFELSVINLESQGKLPELAVQVDNVGRIPEYWVEQANCFQDQTTSQPMDAYFYIVNSLHLDQTTPLFSMKFQVAKVTCSEDYVTIKLAIENPFMQMFPYWTTHPYKCQYQEFRGALCQYSSNPGYATCDRMWETCIYYGNAYRFGGQPGTLAAILSDAPVTSYKGHDAPDPTILVSPNGTITDSTPTFTFQTVLAVTQVELWIGSGPAYNNVVLDGIYDIDSEDVIENSAGTTWSITPEVTFVPGFHRWWVRTIGPGGYGRWSKPMTFNLQILFPGNITLASPSGKVEAVSYDMQFAWTEDTVADSYDWYLARANYDGVYEKLWNIMYTEVQMTSAVTSALPFNLFIEPHKYLRDGLYRWWVRGYSSTFDTYGPWSEPMDFSLDATDTVGKVTLRYPLDTAESDFVAFSWDKDEHATWYAFSLYDMSADPPAYVNSAEGEWFKLEDLNDDSDIITLKYGTKLTLGNTYRWWVMGWNPTGDGLWSNPGTFVCADRPAVTLIEPATTAPSGYLTFSCTEDKAATWYELYVGEGTESAYTKVYDIWYKIDTKDIYDTTPIAVYNNETREMYCTFRLESGKSYVWWVRTWGYNIYGPWSDAKEFTCA